MIAKSKNTLLKNIVQDKVFVERGNVEDFIQKIKTISALLMHRIEIENLDEITIFLIEALEICIKEYEGGNIWG